jgi:protein-S-isoprenylcysteine O-methyltransferase Ste14
MAAQLDRQVSGNEFSRFVGWTRPFGDIRRPDRAPQSRRSAPCTDTRREVSLTLLACRRSLTSGGARVVHASMSGIISGRLENTVSATRGQPLAARVLAYKDKLGDALVDLRLGDTLDRQAIETALATVYALMTGDIAHSRTWWRASSIAGSHATSASRSTSCDASTGPTRAFCGGVEYAPLVQRAAAIIGSAIFLVIAPGTLAVYVPWYLTHWHFAPPLFPIARVLGAALIVAGLPILLDSFARFALQGLGTPAPVMPPKRLVVTGFYRYVRNPMYVAVTALIAGQGLLFGSVTVLEYGAIVWAGFFLFVVAYEEPALGEQFADEYKRYRANVRRWLPRITPWRG